ncbi:formylmethanofuran dehydrogenase subunit B [Limnoglobus roseus]|uniref:Formylmethanofuran dehydrogenase subunit B n=1 Tax=Limnoglobus roseus TaxID=2598579 RepID=A0A5C1AN18_9BACT|nr:formylmethanofuran dehydrogenase subunit B [Limnoglobus roseus]QEL19965.1 formylmethanofuran dehydrogenase subunit B [Limnoglobus roseus]
MAVTATDGFIVRKRSTTITTLLPPLSVVPNATCAGCGCVCDDIELQHDGRSIYVAKNACERGEAWFREQTVERQSSEVLLDAAVEAAAEILHAADLPLVFGLGDSTCEAQREAIALAEQLGGTIDTETSLSHGSMEMAAQLGGKITCTLGEVKNRADFVLYWGANPAETHPRHFERYTLTTTGKYTPSGRADRTLVVVDVRETASTAEADVFLRIRPGQDFEALSILRAVVQGSRFDEAKLAATGLTLDQLRDLSRRMKKARYGIVFVGMGLFQTRGTFMNCAAVTALVIELNSWTRFISMPMRSPGNVSGADAVLSYTTGYPFAVNFSRGYPRYNPGEFSAAGLLARGEVDAALIVGTDAAARLPQAARDHLSRIPTITLDAKPPTFTPRVHITTAAVAAGTVYRMDKVPLTLRPPITSAAPSDETVLRLIRDALAKKSAWYPTAAAVMPAK